MTPAVLLGMSALVLLSGTLPAQVFVDIRKEEMPLQLAATEALYAGDLNGDGWPDIVVGNNPHQARERPAVTLMNDGHGRLLMGWRRGNPASVWAVHDMDLDGDLDLVMQRSVAVNDGHGQFTTPPFPGSYSLRPYRPVAVGDLTGDGLPDIYDGRLLINRGDLQFELVPGQVIGEGDYAIGDVDKDGDLDLIDSGHLLLNDGTGSFTDASSTHLPFVYEEFARVILQDVNLDGDPDLLIGRSPLLFFENSGGGVFTDRSDRIIASIEARTLSLAVGDVDRDGDMDIVEGFSGGGRVLRNSSGQFLADQSFWDPGPVEVDSVVLTDLDRDGDLDLLHGHGSVFQRFDQLQDRLFLNDRGRRLVEIAPSSLPAAANGEGRSVAFGDVNGDGHPDIVNRWTGRILVGDGRGGFRDLGHDLGKGGYPMLGDMDGDGDLDLVVPGSVLKNPGDGRLTGFFNFVPPPSPGGALGDVDGDGDLDLLLTNMNGDLGFLSEPLPDSLWLNDGDGRLTQGPLPPIESRGTEAVAGDLDGDGDLDFLTNSGVLYSNDGDGSFVGSTDLQLSDFTRMALGDLDGDGDLDVALGNWCGSPCFDQPSNRVLWNDGSGAFISTTLPLTFNTLTTSTVIGDVDEDGDADIVFGNGSRSPADPPNHLLLGDGLGGFSNSSSDRLLPYDWDETAQLFLADLDLDRDLDLVTINAPGSPGGNLGRSKVYVNLTRHLRAPYAARMGYPYPLEVHGAERGAAVFIALAPAQIPVPPLGVIGLDPASTALFALLDPPAGRVAVVDVIIPELPALIGLRVYLQSLVFGSTLLDSRLTNTLLEELVNY